MCTGVAAATRVQRPRVVAILGITDFDVAKAGKQPTVASITGWHDTVEHVDTLGDTVNQMANRQSKIVIRMLIEVVQLNNVKGINSISWQGPVSGK